MIVTNQFPKGTSKPITENFALDEFDCNCALETCHFTIIHPLVIKKVQELRKLLGVPLHLSSAFRCMPYNTSKAVGGSIKSKHPMGWAVDIVCPKDVPFQQFAEACKAVFKYTIEYEDKNFVHCDIRVLLKRSWY